MTSRTDSNTAVLELPLGPCTKDPERWTLQIDEGAKALCRQCPRRWQCARDACESPGAEGLWAGIVIPESGRPRTFALRQLRGLAERNGYPVTLNPARYTLDETA
ncbi:MAG: WhiB family transcriptional regulator [Mycobacterium sp.]|nr:WhiB family transcriptional regulator [Mycobacterium sp.]